MPSALRFEQHSLAPLPPTPGPGLWAGGVDLGKVVLEVFPQPTSIIERAPTVAPRTGDPLGCVKFDDVCDQLRTMLGPVAAVIRKMTD